MVKRLADKLIEGKISLGSRFIWNALRKIPIHEITSKKVLNFGLVGVLSLYFSFLSPLSVAKAYSDDASSGQVVLPLLKAKKDGLENKTNFDKLYQDIYDQLKINSRYKNLNPEELDKLTRSYLEEKGHFGIEFEGRNNKKEDKEIQLRVSLTDENLEINFEAQTSFKGQCDSRTDERVCISYSDGYTLLVPDRVVGWNLKEFDNKKIQIARGVNADYYHILGTLWTQKITK